MTADYNYSGIGCKKIFLVFIVVQDTYFIRFAMLDLGNHPDLHVRIADDFSFKMLRYSFSCNFHIELILIIFKYTHFFWYSELKNILLHSRKGK